MAGATSRVFLAGGGACTSVGSTLPATAAAVRAGVSLFGDHPYMVDAVSHPYVVACASFLPAGVEGAMRMLVLAAAAADEALEALGPVASVPVDVIVGLPGGRPALPDDWAHTFVGRLRRHLAVRGHRGPVGAVACGHAAGLIALGEAWQRIRTGAASLCLVGGADSYLDADTLEWLESCDQVHGAGSRNNAWGFVPGEGAGFTLLASEEAVHAHGLPRWGELLAVAVTHEPNRIKTETVCLGHGLTAAFEQVFAITGASSRRIDETFCDMNGEPYRADEFGFATVRTAECFVDASCFDAPADCWGDVGAASGPLLVNLAGRANACGHRRSRRTLVWASSESGERAAAVIGFDDPASARAAR